MSDFDCIQVTEGQDETDRRLSAYVARTGVAPKGGDPYVMEITERYDAGGKEDTVRLTDRELAQICAEWLARKAAHAS